MPPTEHISRGNSYATIQDAYCSIEISTKTESSGEAADFETAIHYARFGKFQKVLLAVCGTIYATCAISTTTLSFVLPSAHCDFGMSSADKGRLSAMPLVGMVFGCGLWGSIADSQGRKVAIMLSLLVDFLAAVISSFATSFNMFLVCRFFNGFGIIGATSIVFSYLGEFLSIKHRERLLGRLEIFWTVGIIILPGVAWTLLNKTLLQMFADHGNFSPWRIFVLVCSFPSLISLVMLYFLPETPKFLISMNNFEKAKQAFRIIYNWNTGLHPSTYPVLTLEGEYEYFTNKCLNKQLIIPLSYKIMGRINRASYLFSTLTSKPYLKYLGIVSFADFGLMASYFTLVMWFPEIFQRFNDFEVSHPNATSSVCGVSQTSTFDFNDYEDFEVEACDPSIGNSVFIDTIIIGLSCIPSSVSLSYFMNKLGKKHVLVLSLMLSGLATLSLNWVQSSNQALLISCVFEALTSILEATLFCVVVDLFPTNLRAIALAITATSGRLGAISGNVMFGILIDINCIVPIYVFGSLLFASGILCLAIPRNENYITLH